MLNARPEVWEALASARIFLTGATGFFGIWLLSAFQYAFGKRKFKGKVTALSREPESFLQKFPQFENQDWLSFLKGDVLETCFPDMEVDYVIHAASEVSGPLNQKQPFLVFDIASSGTRRMLDFALKSGAKRFLLTSSGAVYGNQPPEISHLPETYLGGPDILAHNAAYGEGKRAAELFCNQYFLRYGLETIVARCFAFAGPHLPLGSHFAIGNFVRDYLAGGPVKVEGDGSPFRSYLYAADLVVWLLTALVKGKPGEAYNIGSDYAIDIESLAVRIASSGSDGIDVEIARNRIPGQLSTRYVPSVEKAKNALSLQIFTSIDDAIKKMVLYYSSE